MALENGHADAETDADSAPEPDTSGGERAAAITAKAITVGTKLIPKQSTLFRKLALNSIKQYHKRAGGDALAIDARAGQQLDLTPVKYRSAGECDEGEKPGWVAKDGTKTWHAASEGRVVDYLNNTPIVALDRDSHVEHLSEADRDAERGRERQKPEENHRHEPQHAARKPELDRHERDGHSDHIPGEDPELLGELLARDLRQRGGDTDRAVVVVKLLTHEVAHRLGP